MMEGKDLKMIVEYLKKRFAFRNILRQQQRSKPALRTRPRVEQFEDRTVPSVLNLTGGTTSGLLNGGRFELMNQQPAGSGVIDPFVRLHATGCCDTTPEGHNTSGRNAGSPKLNFDENSSPVFTHNLQLKDIPIITIGSGRDAVRYREFRLDVNDPNHNPAVSVSLNKVKIFRSDSANLLAIPTNLATLGNLVWDMDGNTASASTSSGADLDSASPSANGNWVNLNDRNHGSGQADMRLLVPDSLFTGSPNQFIYFYSRFGDTNPMSGGFEEWYVGAAARDEAVNVVTRIDRELSGGGEIQGPIDGSITHAPLGSTVHDHALVTPADGTGTPTGTVTFSFWNTNDGCSGDPLWTATYPLGTQTPSQGPLAAGGYSFVARYNGDSNFSPGVAACERLQVAKGTLTLTTVMHQAPHAVVADGGHVNLGTVMHDNAAFTAGVVAGFAPTGAVSFTLTGPSSSTLTTLPGEAGFYATSSSTLALAAGNYAFNVSYAGDSNYNAIASGAHNPETFVVDKAQLAIRTDIHNASHGIVPDGGHVSLGSVMHDTATVTGGVAGFALPGVSFTLNGGTVANAAPEAGYTATSVDSAPLAAGSYNYQASVAGNENYLGATSALEPFTVDKAQLAIRTDIHKADHTILPDGGSVPLGSVMHDTATVTGGVAGFALPGVSFTLNGGAVANAAPEAGYTATSVDSAPLAAGSYNYQASVAGNDNYIGATSALEPFTVNRAQLAIRTDIHSASHQIIPDGSRVPFHSNVHDTATVTGAVAGFAIPGVSFFLNGNPVATDPSADPPATARSVDSGPLVNGSYTYYATVGSDSNYIGAQSADEPLTVNPNLNRTQGYWKTHAGFGSQENAWPVESISIGGVVYTKAEAVAIMEISTAGNAISSLFQQLVAFKLNVLSGFSAATASEQAAADGADAAIATATGGNKLLIVAPNTLNYIVDPSSVLGQEMVGYITILTAFNESSGL